MNSWFTLLKTEMEIDRSTTENVCVKNILSYCLIFMRKRFMSSADYLHDLLIICQPNL